MAVNRDYVLKIAPEFEETSNERMAFIIDIAKQSVNTNVWGAKADYAVALLTAHILTESKRAQQGVTGAVKSEQISDTKTSYDNAPQSNSEYSSTNYGREFLRVRKSIFITPMVI